MHPSAARTLSVICFFFQAEDGIRDGHVTGVQTCALPIFEPHTTYMSSRSSENFEISMRLSLEGIGALLQRDSEYTTIVEVIPGGPADLDGRLQPQDRVGGVGQGEDGDITDVIGSRPDEMVEQ